MSDCLHLLLGDPRDLCCREVRDALEARGYPTRVTANPLGDGSRFSWSLDSERSESSLAWGTQTPVRDVRIAGVLVLGPALVDPSGWKPDDLTYVQAETQAALLAWLWSLACPVVNRYPPAIWYRPRPPLLSWHGPLHRAKLSTPPALLTNVEHEARAFGRRLADDSLDAAVYGALTSEARYLVASEDDWSGLAALQRVTPVFLSAPHGEAQRVCVAGDRVVWDGGPSAEAARLEPALRSFAAGAGLACVELALAPTAKGLCVVAVETQPRLEHFGDAARREIVDGIVMVLTTQAEAGRGR